MLERVRLRMVQYLGFRFDALVFGNADLGCTDLVLAGLWFAGNEGTDPYSSPLCSPF